MAFMTGPYATVGSVTDIHTTAKNPLGMQAWDALGNEYIYLQGVASVVATDFVTYDEAFLCTRLVAGGSKGPVAVALAAVVASTYGWFQKGGLVSGNVAAADADNAAQWATATAGRVDDAVVAGDQVSGVIQRSAISGNTATMQLDRPWFGLSVV